VLSIVVSMSSMVIEPALGLLGISVGV
jgi:hypothetical protein